MSPVNVAKAPKGRFGAFKLSVSDDLFEHADRQIQTKTLLSPAILSTHPIHTTSCTVLPPIPSPEQATFIGLFAVCFWSSVIGLIRTLSLHMGAVGGAAVMYSLATILLLLIFGKPDLRRFSRITFFGQVSFCRLRTVSVPFHRICRQRQTNRRNRHGQLFMADFYHHRRGLVQ